MSQEYFWCMGVTIYFPMQNVALVMDGFNAERYSGKWKISGYTGTYSKFRDGFIELHPKHKAWRCVLHLKCVPERAVKEYQVGGHELFVCRHTQTLCVCVCVCAYIINHGKWYHSITVICVHICVCVCVCVVIPHYTTVAQSCGCFTLLQQVS